MKALLAFIIVFSTFNAVAQMDWSKTSRWKIYKVPEPIMFRIPIDSLTQTKSQTLREDSILMYIGTSTILPDSIKPIWMGGWVATYELSGQEHKIEISSYGAFFYDQSSNRFYQIPMEIKEDWMTFIHQKLSLL
jgi:hypothetical protein